VHNTLSQIAKDQGLEVTLRDDATGQTMTLIFGPGERSKRGTLMVGHVLHQVTFRLVRLPHTDPMADLTMAIHVEDNYKLTWDTLEPRLSKPVDELAEKLKVPVTALQEALGKAPAAPTPAPPTLAAPVPVVQVPVVTAPVPVVQVPVIEIPVVEPRPVATTTAEVPPPAPPTPRPPVAAPASTEGVKSPKKASH
jgi:hypothetical protein